MAFGRGNWSMVMDGMFNLMTFLHASFRVGGDCAKIKQNIDNIKKYRSITYYNFVSGL